jgi:hypothetical protein
MSLYLIKHHAMRTYGEAFLYSCNMSDFATCLMLVSCLGYSSILKIGATCSSETSVDFQHTVRCCFPEDVFLITTAVRTSNPA